MSEKMIDFFGVYTESIEKQNTKMDYDNWKLATPPHYEYDDEEQEETTYDNLTEAYESADTEIFENMQSEIIHQLKIVYEALKATDHGLTKKVLSIIKKMG